MFQTGDYEHSSNYPVLCWPCHNLFQTWYWHQDKHIITKYQYNWGNIKYLIKNFSLPLQPLLPDYLLVWHGPFISEPKQEGSVSKPLHFCPTSSLLNAASLSEVSLHTLQHRCHFPLTWASVALVACVCDLCSQVQVVLPLLRHAIISTNADHAPREAGQVAHLVIQDPSPPLSHVGQTPRWLLYQVGFYRLQGNTRSGIFKSGKSAVY